MTRYTDHQNPQHSPGNGRSRSIWSGVNMTQETDVLLTVEFATKRFGGALALDCVSMDLYAGQVHALLGENGAGKSTLVKALAGITKLDSGSISGKATESPSGIAIVFQELSIIPDLSIRDN